MENDDIPVGRMLTRREVLALLGVGSIGLTGAGWSEGGAATTAQTVRLATQSITWPGGVPACVVRPAQTEGPYFVDEKLNRVDIRTDPGTRAATPGRVLDLEVRVARIAAGGCAPLVGAIVDIWQCDAVGVYSDVKDFQGKFDTRGQKFLRGYQLTDATGSARFTTVYPGWYEGRTAHLHFKVRTPAGEGRAQEFTSQLYFDDVLSDAVYTQAPYAGRPARDTRNANDGIFRKGGAQLTLALAPRGAGYASVFEIGLQTG